MNKLTIAEAAYLAGLMDGEGYIGLTRSRIRGAGEWAYVLKVVITNSNYEIIKWCINITNIGFCCHMKEQKKRKLTYQWQLRADEIFDLLESLLPYLRIKQQQAVLILEYTKNCRGTCRIVPLIETLVWRELIYEDLQILNKRGVD